jgi:hypothetical protein
LDKVTTENELKKEYLRSYHGHVRRIARIESELAELRTMRMSISVSNDGMPKGSGTSDLSGYAAELDRLERNLMAERYHRIKVYTDIADNIKKLKSENEKDVLFFRYIKGMDWWEIADKMRYSERWVHKIHGNALAHFELQKEKVFIEVQ